jgi:hypothetical protein
VPLISTADWRPSVEDDLDRMGILAGDSPLPRSRIRFLAEADESVIEQITCGVVFVMAFWSGPSRQAYRKLTEVLAALDPEGRLEFVVVDVDGCPALYDRAEFIGRMSGAGETAWVKDGHILCDSGRGYNPECFGPNTRMLLSTYPEAGMP